MNKLFKLFQYLILGMFACHVVSSCSYLDIVPNETATEEDAFESTEAALRYLYSCYSYLPQSENTHTSISTACDEIVSCFGGEPTQLYFQGGYTASNRGNVEEIYNNMYTGIRQCYLLKQHISSVPDITQATIDSYVNQADFLIAYYHMVLMQHYGPIILVKELTSTTTPAHEYLARSTYDECADWIAGEFKRLSTLLPARRTGSDYGLATSVAALALRSRVLLYKASPLFNGNAEYYSSFTNPDGTHLISQEFDRNKYKEAADAALEAISLAEANGYSLFTSAEGSTITSMAAPYPQDPVQRRLRLTITDEYSSEVLWANTRSEPAYSIQSKSRPFLIWGAGYGTTLKMVERFYTENGLPIDEDPAFDYEGRYGTCVLDNDTRGEGVTLKLHDQREPRFYAWVAFHNGYYECRSARIVSGDQEQVTNGAYWESHERSNGSDQRWLTNFTRNGNCGKGGRTNNYSMTGYLNKKGVRPDYQAPATESAPTQDYPKPIIRLGEVYLNYAEACVGYGESSYVADGMNKLNAIRERAGIPSVLTSWAKAKHPIANYESAVADGRLMDIVVRERMIELYMEGHNFWDLRRWKIAEENMGTLQQGLNIDGATEGELLQVITINQPRNFISPANYLMPIPNNQVNTNKQMVQNPGY